MKDTSGASDLGKRIRTARLRARLSQATLAELADCTTETLARAERGESVPRTDTLQRLAAVLGEPLAGLLGASKSGPRPRLAPELQALVRELSDLPRSDLSSILAVVRLAARGARQAASTKRPTRSGRRA
ncbi:MAG: helix-turn-helix domain-containing protein [Deltaproteobacteria bacterium]|nr:helix-turn-helix domain-containing protein [Deltaproteobacteria bacterium]